MDESAREAIKGQFFESVMGIKRMMTSFHQWHDLHIGEVVALKHIAERDAREGGYISELQSELNVSKPAVSQMIGVLEKKGYVAREVSAADRRRVALTLTESGREAYLNMEAQFERFIDRLLDLYGEEESKQLTVLLSRLAGALETLKAEFKENTTC